LTFNVLLDKLLDSSKLQTTRGNVMLWQDRHRRALNGGPRVLDIWWRNPRTKRYNPDCYKMGLGNWDLEEFVILQGKEFTSNTARLDGFNDVEEYIRALATRNKLAPHQVLEKEWPIISWDWTRGPYGRGMQEIQDSDLVVPGVRP
jgi:hypothetical protein